MVVITIICVIVSVNKWGDFMKNIFLYLYPIEEYSKVFCLENDYYDGIGVRRPFDVLNETIQKRYRDNGFQVIFVLYPDKEIYGILPQHGDSIIYADIPFSKASGYNFDGSEKNKDEIIYPNEQNLINQLGDVEELVIGGYHAQDCVKRVGEVALANGINTIIDLDMTDLFFSLYRQEDYFDLESYSPERFKNYMLAKIKRYGEEFAEEMFKSNYQSEAYGFGYPNEKQK